MATSVPVPMARPRSAWASAAASLTPSPTIATTRPSACSRLTTSTLSAGSTSAITSSMPTSAATARATVSLSPVSSTGVRPRSRSCATASALVGLTASATTSTPRAAPSQPTATAVRPAASARGHGALRARRGRCWRPLGQQPRRGRRAPRARRRRPARRGPRRWRSPRPAGSVPTRSAAPAAMAWAIGCSEASSSAPASRSSSLAILAVGDDDVDQGHPAGGDGAGLVQHDGVDPAGGLQHLRALDQDAELGAAAGADQQRGRRGQAERARAGDDQHGDRGGERGGRRRRRCRARSRGWPTARAMTIGTKTPEIRSASRCTGGLAVLRVLDQPGHLGQLGVGADPGGAHDQPAAGVDGGADDGVAGADLDRHRLAGEHARRRPPRRPRRPRRRWRSSRRAGRRTGRRRRAASIGIRASAPSRSTATSLAPSSSRARSAAPARRLARASK